MCENKWLPIETAPKDGTKVDLWCTPRPGAIVAPEHLGGWRIADAWFSAGRWWTYENNDEQRLEVQADYVTHWQPLPDPPASPALADGGER